MSLLFRQKTVLEAEAEAEAIALRGDAKAFAVEAKAKAEAEQMAKKADAWNEYGKAALMDMMLKVKFFFIRFHFFQQVFLIFIRLKFEKILMSLHQCILCGLADLRSRILSWLLSQFVDQNV